MTESAPELVEGDGVVAVDEEARIEPRDVTDENPIEEGEVPEGLVVAVVAEDEVVTTDVVVSSDDPELPELVAPPEDHPDPDPEEPEEFEPHELDLPPAAPAEDVPAPHAPYDPSHGAR